MPDSARILCSSSQVELVCGGLTVVWDSVRDWVEASLSLPLGWCLGAHPTSPTRPKLTSHSLHSPQRHLLLCLNDVKGQGKGSGHLGEQAGLSVPAPMATRSTGVLAAWGPPSTGDPRDSQSLRCHRPRSWLPQTSGPGFGGHIASSSAIHS